MLSLTKIWNAIQRRPAVVYSTFWIGPERVLGGPDPSAQFVPNESYLELRIAEQFLQNQREYLSEYLPMTLLVSEFIYAGQRRIFPFVVGPSLIQNIDNLEGDEGIQFFNTRVAGPVPYVGDEVTILTSLFRIRTSNWARQALSLLESIAKSFDPTRLTSFVSLSGSILDAVEGFLGIDDTEFRMGERRSFSDPADGNHATVLRPGFLALVRDGVSATGRKQFWIVENRLHHGPDERSLQPFRAQDFVLLQIGCLGVRNDLNTFDFHKEWEQVQQLIWQGKREEAVERFLGVARLLIASPDLTNTHKNRLLGLYKKKYHEDVTAYDATLGAQDAGSSPLPPPSTSGRTYDNSGEGNTAKKAGERVTGPVPLMRVDIEHALYSEEPVTEVRDLDLAELARELRN